MWISWYRGQEECPYGTLWCEKISLTNDSIRVLGVHFSYNLKLYVERNFIDCIKKLQDVIRVWSMRSLSLYGKIVIFKTLALSKTVYIACMSNIPTEIIKLAEQIHKHFIWNKKRPSIKHWLGTIHIWLGTIQ